ncbi:MAG: tRNA pseudouridine(55) synthase TruB [Bacteroidia bacterium]|jgi:tRNA pseudouridine55 synthase|nr:tRNA pseudouridine(55) synthase TruB [Bacteroidia bacterium]
MMVLIDKPLEWTSFDAVNKMKYALKSYMRRQVDEGKWVLVHGQKLNIKIGHAGTLDPLASGLLIVCIGKQTKQIETYMGQDKEYTGTFYIGATTPSFDLETEVNAHFGTSHITPELIHQTALQFIGKQQQFPPVYSAIKKDGKRLYESAREGKEVELTSRTVNIIEFEITDIQLPLVSFRIACGKGTYIRSIANDFGKALGSGAYLHSLRRTKIGTASVAEAMSVDGFVNWVSQA